LPTLIDAGPLIAAADPRDPRQSEARETIRTLDAPLITTEAVITEGLHIIGSRRRWAGQERLLALLQALPLELYAIGNALETLSRLMSQYRNVPMDFADAGLVHLSERLNVLTIFTRDRDFAIYRSAGRPLRVILLPPES
jgi:uncharacterized protein